MLNKKQTYMNKSLINLENSRHRLADATMTRSMKITFLPHAEEQMHERGISEDQVRETLSEPDAEYPVGRGRIRAERRFQGMRLAVKVVYNLSSETGECIIVSAMRGRPTRR